MDERRHEIIGIINQLVELQRQCGGLATTADTRVQGKDLANAAQELENAIYYLKQAECIKEIKQ